MGVKRFQAYVVEKREDGFHAGLRELTLEDLPAGEVTVRVLYSSMNYKDGLACSPDGRVVRSYPMVPGIDLAGTVTASDDPRFRPGDAVLATGYDLGVAHYGGFSEYARVPAGWLVPLPAGLTLRDAMILGTAGFTAALALHRLEGNGLRPDRGAVLVTGATGGVGSLAVSLLARLGYQVSASTGKAAAHDYLRRLGAQEVLDRQAVCADAGKPLETQRWAGAIDSVGGSTLSWVLRTTRYGGAVAAVGLAGGSGLQTTVFPFILRAVSLLGIDSAYCPMDLRLEIWRRLASDWRPSGLAEMAQEIALADVPAAAAVIRDGRVRGRMIVRLA